MSRSSFFKASVVKINCGLWSCCSLREGKSAWVQPRTAQPHHRLLNPVFSDCHSSMSGIEDRAETTGAVVYGHTARPHTCREWASGCPQGSGHPGWSDCDVGSAPPGGMDCGSPLSSHLYGASPLSRAIPYAHDCCPKEGASAQNIPQQENASNWSWPHGYARTMQASPYPPR